MRRKPGPIAGSEGAKRIAAAHRGSRPHDKKGGFAANPELAKAAGQRGGERVKEKYGEDHFRNIGKIGGGRVLESRGIDFFAKIGQKGGQAKGKRNQEPHSVENE